MIGNLNDLIVKRFTISYVDVGKLLLIPYFCGAIFSLMVGKILIEKPKYRRLSFFIASILYLLGTIALYILTNKSSE